MVRKEKIRFPKALIPDVNMWWAQTRDPKAAMEREE
jgi:hypothetical protein